MEIVKRKFLNVGSTYGINVCMEAVFSGDDPDASKFMYNNRKIGRRDFYKCIFCRFEHRPAMCERFACMKNERKDGKSVFFGRI